MITLVVTADLDLPTEQYKHMCVSVEQLWQVAFGMRVSVTMYQSKRLGITFTLGNQKYAITNAPSTPKFLSLLKVCSKLNLLAIDNFNSYI